MNYLSQDGRRTQTLKTGRTGFQLGGLGGFGRVEGLGRFEGVQEL